MTNLSSPLHRWLLLLAVAVPFGVGALWLDLPAAMLLCGLCAGLVAAVVERAPTMPRPAVLLSEVSIGISIGALASSELFLVFVTDWQLVVLSIIGTMIVAFGSGQVLRLHRGISLGTSLLAAIPGGAVGVIAASDREYVNLPVVAAVQYVRVLVLVFTLPLFAAMFGAASSASGSPSFVEELLTGFAPIQVLFFSIALVVSLVAVRFIRFASSALLIPMVLAAILATTGLFAAPTVPGVIMHAAYFVVGVNIGSKFTRASLRVVARILPLVAAYIVLTVVGGLGLAFALSAILRVSLLDAFLATTPAGIFPVVAVAASGGASIAVIAAAQFLRVFIALLSVPVCDAIARPRGDAATRA